jgi:hypothetical protein
MYIEGILSTTAERGTFVDLFIREDGYYRRRDSHE